MINFFRKTFHLARRAAENFMEHDPITLAGAVAFFTIFSIPPILIIIISGVGFFAGHQFVSNELFGQIRSMWGEQGANMIRDVINNYVISKQSIFQKIFSIIIFLFASSSFFVVIQNSLNRIWNVKPKPNNNLLSVLRNRALSFGAILLLGIMLVISFALESTLVFLQHNLDFYFPNISPLLFGLIGYLLSFTLVTLIFAFIFKFLPDVIIEWKVVWVGSAITALLFSLGKFIINFALQNSTINEMYGIVGSLVIVLLWVFYIAIILFYGAEITQQYAYTYAKTIQPKPYAIKIVTHEARTSDAGES